MELPKSRETQNTWSNPQAMQNPSEAGSTIYDKVRQALGKILEVKREEYGFNLSHLCRITGLGRTQIRDAEEAFHTDVGFKALFHLFATYNIDFNSIDALIQEQLNTPVGQDIEAKGKKLLSPDLLMRRDKEKILEAIVRAGKLLNENLDDYLEAAQFFIFLKEEEKESILRDIYEKSAVRMDQEKNSSVYEKVRERYRKVLKKGMERILAKDRTL